MAQANRIRSEFKYVTDANGKVEAVVLNLKNGKVRELWEDFADTLTINERLDEPTRSFDEVKAEILAQRTRAKA